MATKNQKPYYSEPGSFFPESIRRAAKIGEFSEKGAKANKDTTKKGDKKRS